MNKRIFIALSLAYLGILALSLLIAFQPEISVFEPIYRISQTTGILVSAILMFGFLRLLAYIIKAKLIKSLLRPSRWLLIAGGYREHLKNALVQVSNHAQIPWRARLAQGSRLLLLTAAAAYTLTFFEWLFHVTKVSFMDSMTWGQKAIILLLSGLFIAAAGMVLNMLLLLVELGMRRVKLAWLAACVNAAVPAALFTSLVVLWVDSFTYTLFHFGILTSDGASRVIYGLLVVLIFLGIYRRLLKSQGFTQAAPSRPSGSKWLRVAVVGLIAISTLLAATQFTPASAAAHAEESDTAPDASLPDIILIGGDGLSATHMSLYGYDRLTTPNLDAIADVSLLAENAFSNANKTYGSIISMLTSKMPTRTQVIFPPDILRGIDSDQHLPGILKSLGYTTAQIGVNEYVDANTWNIHHAFDYVNQRTVQGEALVNTLDHAGYGLPAYFIFIVEGRLVNRLLQALCIETVENPFSTVADAPQWRGDRRRMDDLLNLLESTPEPLFVQVHLLETHGPTYEPAIRQFSAGIEQDEKWMTDFYDDTILSYDAYIGELIDALKAAGRFDQTLLIFYSDHAMGFQTAERIPLMIHFPNDQHAGRIQTDVQNLDIAPTILETLGVPAPEWMEGESILHFSDQVREPIFAVRVFVGLEHGTEATGAYRYETENHVFSVLQVFYCQRIYVLDMIEMEWKVRNIYKHTAPCAGDQLLDLSVARQAAIQFLTEQGYETDVIP